MAEYRVIHASNGRVRYELDYRGETFNYTMVPNEYGATGDKGMFDVQVEQKFPNELEDVLEALSELGFCHSHGTGKILEELAAREKQLEEFED